MVVVTGMFVMLPLVFNNGIILQYLTTNTATNSGYEERYWPIAMLAYPFVAGVFGGTRAWYSVTANEYDCQIRTAHWLESGVLSSQGNGTWCCVYCIGKYNNL